MVFEVKDLTGLGEPLTKLMDVVSRGLGTIWRPRAIRAEADAKAYEIEKIAEAQVKAESIKANGQYVAVMSRIQELAEFSPDIAKRAHQRLLAQEICGQENLEAVVEQAYLALPEVVSKEPIDETWRRKFFQEAEGICDEDFQLLWGKILAGEICSPGSFSLRTLSVLRELNRSDAELFRVACSLAMGDGHIALPGDDLNTALTPFGLTFSKVMQLRDAGLVAAGDQLTKTYASSLNVDDAPAIGYLTNNGVVIQLKISPRSNVSYPMLSLSLAGIELQRLMSSTPNEGYLTALGVFWRAKSIAVKRGVSVTQSDGSSTQVFDQDL